MKASNLVEITGIKFANELREDLLVTACEGGSNYWASIEDEGKKLIRNATKHLKGEPFATRFWDALKKGLTIPVHDAEEPGTKLGEISLESIAKAEVLLANKQSYHLGCILDDNWDAGNADVWFQLATLGDVVYG